MFHALISSFASICVQPYAGFPDAHACHETNDQLLLHTLIPSLSYRYEYIINIAINALRS